MADTYWWWHQSDAPSFDADHAWSATGGSQFTADGSTYMCAACEATGEAETPICPCFDEDYAGCARCERGTITECPDCDGEDTIKCDRGYSCCHSAASLVAYFTSKFMPPQLLEEGTVYFFEGEGIEGEPLAVPTRVLETLTWAELVDRVKEGV